MALSTSGSSALTERKEALASTKLASTWILSLHSCPRNVLTNVYFGQRCLRSTEGTYLKS